MAEFMRNDSSEFFAVKESQKSGTYRNGTALEIQSCREAFAP
jgi:hypothetical protein